MGQLSAKLRKTGSADGYTAGGIAHWCPACKEMHAFAIDAPFKNGARWSWNGNVDQPSCTPSMNISWGPYKDDEIDIPLGRCHYFLTNGMIKFCSDSTHELAGKDVPLPDLPAHLKD
jgi:hypothetical protein